MSTHSPHLDTFAGDFQVIEYGGLISLRVTSKAAADEGTWVDYPLHPAEAQTLASFLTTAAMQSGSGRPPGCAG